eukprot:10029661-Karenia_brevis.AAC.1
MVGMMSSHVYPFASVHPLTRTNTSATLTPEATSQKLGSRPLWSVFLFASNCTCNACSDFDCTYVAIGSFGVRFGGRG